MEEEMKETSKVEVKPEMKIRREITSLDDDELWAGFEWEETERILSGEIKPKTLIGSYHDPSALHPLRASLIAQEMLSVFPNSKYIRSEITYGICELVKFAKKKGYTSLILTRSNMFGDDYMSIISLLNGATAAFRIYNLLRREDIPNCADPPLPRIYPQLHMRSFTSPGSAGTARMIQSLFPKVPRKVPRNLGRSVAWFRKQKDLIFFRSHCFCSKEEAVAGEGSSVRAQKPQECGPRFSLQLLAVESLPFDTGIFKTICMVKRDYLDCRV